MLLHERFENIAQDNRTKDAAVFQKESLTFGQLNDLSGEAAKYLLDHGVKPGDRVALLLPHCPEAVIFFWGALKAGAIVVSLSDQLPLPALSVLINDAEPAVVITRKTLADQKLTDAESASIQPVITTDDGVFDAADWTARPDTGASGLGETDPIAAIVYTSGSTGKPKGVCLSHVNLMTVIDGVIEHMPITDRDSYLMVVPLHYVHGLMQLLVHHLAGATIHFSAGFVFPGQVVKQIASSRVTGFSGVPYHFAAIMDRGGFAEADLPVLRWVTSTGGKLSSDLIKRLREARPDVQLHVAYGQTECAPRATALSPDKIDVKPESVGSAIPGVQVDIIDAEGNGVKRGEVGEVVISGKNIMVGYWRQPEATREVVDEQGRLHTGDLGWLDAEGDLFLSGRRNTMLKTAGERIFAEELEEILERHEKVAKAVVLGIPDPLYGDRIEAHLHIEGPDLSDGETAKDVEAAVRKHCLAAVPFSRAPRKYHLWPELPHTHAGKVDRVALKTRSEAE